MANQSPSLGDRVPVTIRVPVDEHLDTVRVRVIRDAEPEFVTAVPDGIRGGEQCFTAEIELHNPVTQYRFQLDRGVRGYSWVNGTGEHQRDIPDVHDFRLTGFDPGPDWARDAVVYQIFPDRFARSDAVHYLPDWAKPAEWDDTVTYQGPETPLQFFGGDLDGVRAHIAHLDHLGVDTVYLTPIFPARSNHRYNATTFDHVDPLLGGDAALTRLSADLRSRGMRLIGDFTTNHSGDDHAWFSAAAADAAAAERAFYYFDELGDYVSWLGHKSLPKFDLESVELRERLFGLGDSVVARWLREPFGLDGWRIDVANMTGRHAVHDHGSAVARLIRQTVDAVRPESVLIAEYTNDFTADLLGDGWQGSMNYAGFGRPVWSWLESAEYEAGLLGKPYRIAKRPGGAAVATMREFAAAVPWKVASRHWNLTSSHDTARIRTVTGSGEMVRVAAGLLFGYLGTPMVFAGDELGLEGVSGEDARRPMPWDRPDTWDHATFDAYRDLIAVRRGSEALRRGGLRWVIETDDAIGFLRETADERVLVVAARAPWSGAVLPPAWSVGPAETLYGGMDLEPGVDGLLVPGAGPRVGIWRLA